MQCSGMWVVRGTTERKRQSLRSLETWCDVQHMRGIGHAADDWLRMASVEREFRTSGQRIRSAKKCAPGVTTDELERKIQWGPVRPPDDMQSLQEAGVVEWQVVHAHGMDGGAERMGIRRVQWVASPRPGGSASARPVGRFECGKHHLSWKQDETGKRLG